MSCVCWDAASDVLDLNNNRNYFNESKLDLHNDNISDSGSYSTSLYFVPRSVSNHVRVSMEDPEAMCAEDKGCDPGTYTISGNKVVKCWAKVADGGPA